MNRFEEALEEFEHNQKLTSGAPMTWPTVETITYALKLAAKLEQEPSEGMYDACYKELKETQSSFAPIAYHVFKAMLKQAKREIE